MESKDFDLKDWQLAFQHYRKQKERYGVENVQFVLSTHPYTEGYWVERRGTLVESFEDFVYLDNEVDALEERVKKGVEDNVKDFIF